MVPAYNEEELIGETLSGIPEYVDGVYVVDDGSADNTPRIILEHQNGDPRIVVINHEKNRGVGGAIVAGYRKALSSPFMVLATQLPYGEQGTYPLTSVQIDRFSYRVEVHSPDPVSEAKILGRVDMIDEMDGDVIIDSKEILELSKIARNVYVDDSVKKYIVDLVQYIRRSPHVRMGPSPRASIWLYRGSRVKAMMDGRGHVLPDDVKGLVGSVIPHRIELKPQARAGEVTPMGLVEEALEKVAVPKGIE